MPTVPNDPPRGEVQKIKWFYARAEAWRAAAERAAQGERPDPAVINALCNLSRLHLEFARAAAGDPVAEAVGGVSEMLVDIVDVLGSRNRMDHD